MHIRVFCSSIAKVIQYLGTHGSFLQRDENFLLNWLYKSQSARFFVSILDRDKMIDGLHHSRGH